MDEAEGARATWLLDASCCCCCCCALLVVLECSGAVALAAATVVAVVLAEGVGKALLVVALGPATAAAAWLSIMLLLLLHVAAAATSKLSEEGLCHLMEAAICVSVDIAVTTLLVEMPSVAVAVASMAVVVEAVVVVVVVVVERHREADPSRRHLDVVSAGCSTCCCRGTSSVLDSEEAVKEPISAEAACGSNPSGAPCGVRGMRRGVADGCVPLRASSSGCSGSTGAR